MHTSTRSVVIVSDDPSFSTELQHHLREGGVGATLQRSDEGTLDTITTQHPRLLVVHASDVEGTVTTGGTLAEQVQQAPGIDHVPVVVCADHRAVLEATVKQLAQHRGTVVASSCQVDEVRAKLYDLDAHATR